MYAVIQSPTNHIPSVIAMNNELYPDFVMSGYQVLFTGTKKKAIEMELLLLSEIDICND